MENRIERAKEQASSRKEILEKVEKWKIASEEERWLDDYERVLQTFNTINLIDQNFIYYTC